MFGEPLEPSLATKKEPNTPSGADHCRKITVAGAGCYVIGLWRKFKMVEEDSYSTDLTVSGEEGHLTILLAHYILGYNCGQSYLATLVTPQNCTKMLRNLTFI